MKHLQIHGKRDTYDACLHSNNNKRRVNEIIFNFSFFLYSNDLHFKRNSKNYKIDSKADTNLIALNQNNGGRRLNKSILIGNCDLEKLVEWQKFAQNLCHQQFQ